MTKKFEDMKLTAKGEDRASVILNELKTLWFNTGTLCNLQCKNCYIESSPKNDRLSFITKEDITPFLDEIKNLNLGTELIGLTGGEPFLNPSIIEVAKEVLTRGLPLLILTNANRVIKRYEADLLRLLESYGENLMIRISLDHYTQNKHEEQRGNNTFIKTMQEIRWLYDEGFHISIAGRSLVDESHEQAISGYKNLLKEYGVELDLNERLVIFPEMRSKRDVPEITTKCWDILEKSPDDQMCATERMIVKRKGTSRPLVMPCTLLAYDDKFILGNNLKESNKEVHLNHRFCAEFCVLGGASCSSTK